MPPQYAKPPLIEALSELYVAEARGWSGLSIERLEKRFAARFSGKRDFLDQVTVHLTIKPDASEQAVLPRIRRRRMWTADESQMVQFDATMCAFNVLKNYTTFDDYMPQIADVYANYLEEAQPTHVEWTGQRYINRVVLPPGESDPSRFFTFYPTLPPSSSHRPFALQVVTERFASGEVVVSLNYRGPEEEGEVYFLEVLARSTTTLPVDKDALLAWQQHAHGVLAGSFELAIAPRAREIFGAA